MSGLKPVCQSTAAMQMPPHLTGRLRNVISGRGNIPFEIRLHDEPNYRPNCRSGRRG